MPVRASTGASFSSQSGEKDAGGLIAQGKSTEYRARHLHGSHREKRRFSHPFLEWSDMPTYHFHLENSTGPTGDVTIQDLAGDEEAVKEAGTAAAEVLQSELSEGCSAPHAVVTVKRGGKPLAVARAQASIERLPS